MVERGVRFVNIIHASWDHHSNLDPEISFNARMSDQPIAALINDLKERGLLDETLVVWAGEFGRTPLGENRPGRRLIQVETIIQMHLQHSWLEAVFVEV